MIRVDITRTKFYKELSAKEQRDYFDCTGKCFLPNIDNIYYTVSFKGDSNENKLFVPLFKKIEEVKQLVKETKETELFFNDLYVDFKSFNIYKYCLTCTDLYDIFILDYLPNLDTPRILIQIRSYGLWNHSYKEMVDQSFANVQALFSEYGMLIDNVRENRIDYCYHTNSVQNMTKTFKDLLVKKHMKTTLKTWHGTGRIKVELEKDYFALGERKSNNVFVRFYNKTIEVIEKGYKGYFFQLWKDKGLISFYDQFCFEYAYQSKNFEHIHKAKLEFYIQYGFDESKKEEYRELLKDPNKTITDIENIANQYMPKCTTIMNVEFETKRKFYYHSDDFIDNVLCTNNPAPDLSDPKLKRLMTIMYNRQIFLDYLTDTTVRFVDQDGKERIYLDWWKRLRNTKLEEIKVDEKLIKEYSQKLDAKVMRKKFINIVASNAVYMNKPSESPFVEDLMDLLSNINDNDKANQDFNLLGNYGEIIDTLDSEMLEDYDNKKAIKEKRLQNRKIK